MGEVKLGSLKKEIGEIKGTLNSVSAEKEKLFKDKSEADRAITELIKSVKTLKEERDSLTTKVKTAKEERAVITKEIREKIALFKDAKKKSDEIKAKNNLKGAGILEKEIAAMEYKIETEALPFNKEQQLTKIIKQKIKELEQSAKFKELFTDTKTLSKEIDGLKKKSDALYQEIQNNASESQKKHEALIETSKKIDELKNTRETLSEKFTEHKNTLKEASGKLRERVGKLQEISTEMSLSKEKAVLEYKEKTDKLLKQKESEVEEKLKKGKKLTAEDLIIFQGKQ